MNFPPGPNLPRPIVTYRFIKKPYDLLGECYRKYGDMFTLNILIGKAVFIADPDVIQEVFTIHAKKVAAGKTITFLEPFLGENSLLLLDGPEHTRQRRLLLPAFHGERMRMFGDVMQDCAHRAIDRWQPGGTVTLKQEMQEITLNVIVQSVFGLEVNRRKPEIVEMVRGFLNIPTLMTFLPFLRVNLGSWSPWGRFLKWRNKLDKLIYQEIEQRRAQPHPEPQDVLDMLLLSRDEEGNPMTAQEIRDECLTLLLAGHETTALSLTWAFVSLLQKPKVLERLKAELDTVSEGNSVSAEMLPKLTYLEATIKESMRINNLFPIVSRRVMEPIELRGYQLPVGSIVAPCNLLVHQLPHLYPEPHEFRPERWLNNEHHHPYSWFPFGGGPRRCIGINFAQFEMKMLLATILPRVELELLPGQSFSPTRIGLALAPPTGVQVRVKARKPQPQPVAELVHQ